MSRRLPARHGRPVGGRPLQVTRNGHASVRGAWHIMAAIETGSGPVRRLSIWLERTDAHVGVHRVRSRLLHPHWRPDISFRGGLVKAWVASLKLSYGQLLEKHGLPSWELVEVVSSQSMACEACLWSKLRNTWAGWEWWPGRLRQGPTRRSLPVLKTGAVVYASGPVEAAFMFFGIRKPPDFW